MPFLDHRDKPGDDSLVMLRIIVSKNYCILAATPSGGLKPPL